MKFTASIIFVATLVGLSTAQGPDRFSCSCVKGGAAVPFNSAICNGMGGALAGTACSGLTTKTESEDCDALIAPGSTASCIKTT
ncbi:hypothetical protein BKA65DRAFT_558209 [Rhexocercosporidium sp. MPI-PUGE-AT-0058]|nr:hypothetical protein BKA65DRAFT_558209 [Rhexocercosporidium sp. MPI-PUGE-AT-0058]